MKQNQPPENSDPLRKVLHEWQVKASLPPRFPTQVWEQIARTEKSQRLGLLTVLREWVEITFSRPILAGSYLTVLVLIGIGMGYDQGQTQSAQKFSQLQTRYIEMVDPYKTPR